MRYRIVITGAPASAKTEFFERLKAEAGFEKFIFFDELARILLSENPEYRNRRSEFHREIYYRQVAREDAAGDSSFITDRGTVDAFAFHPETTGDVGTTLEREYARYDHVIQLGTCAGLGSEFYKVDAIREETLGEALAIERAITSVWNRHPAYHVVSPEVEIERKYTNFLKLITGLVFDQY